MASQALPPANLPETAAMHDRQDLCLQLLQNINASHILEILPSKIHDNGSGLFAKDAIPEGSEIFRSTPLVTCVADGRQAITCDYCFASMAPNFNGIDSMKPTFDVIAIPEITMCIVCGNCFTKSFEEYHKFECDALAQFPTTGFLTRMLYRMLAIHKQGAISDHEADALRHLWGHRGQNPYGVSSDIIVTTVTNVETLIQSGLGDEKIQDLYCKPPGEESYGGMLDFVGSMINHSCDPNTVMVFECGQLRLRSLKPIRAGDEITQTYTDLKAGVLVRRQELSIRASFTCSCIRCEVEHMIISALTTNEGFSLNDFADTEMKLINLGNQVFTYTAEQLEAALDAHTRAIFTTRPWPDTLKPIGTIRFCLARLSNNYLQAAMHALKGCLSTTNRSGPEWVDSLHISVFLHWALERTADAGEQGVRHRHEVHQRHSGVVFQCDKYYGPAAAWGARVCANIFVVAGARADVGGDRERYGCYTYDCKGRSRSGVTDWDGADERRMIWGAVFGS
ncbi:hypothetical protein V501_06603 [Pseudogymnoascus sp. VKM F-4519 (FW-2642)]|nr:hypothetical protein V501_06603 [Pseudogymnoascus sp. VKM F-4519 (FW-2642)]